MPRFGRSHQNPIKSGGTTSGCSRHQEFICTLRRKPLSTAAIKACREGTRTRRCRRNAAKRIRYRQPTRSETAPSPANACPARTSSPCSNVSKSSLTVIETAAAVSACASSSSPQSTTRSSGPNDGYARGLLRLRSRNATEPPKVINAVKFREGAEVAMKAAAGIESKH
jgi:hypothetical protein